MTLQEAVDAYKERFGFFPNYMFLGAPDDYVIWEIRRALRRGIPIDTDTVDDY